MSAHPQVPSVSPPPLIPSPEGKRARNKREDIEALEFALEHLGLWCLVRVVETTSTRVAAYSNARNAQQRLEIRLAELLAYDMDQYVAEWSTAKATNQATGNITYEIRVRISSSEEMYK